MDNTPLKQLLFFTYGVGPGTWIRSGLYQREMKLYDEIQTFSIDTTFVFYEPNPTSATLIPYKYINLWPTYCSFLPSYLRSITYLLYTLCSLPKLLCLASQVDLLKTNQIPGSLVAVLVSLLSRKPLYVRAGYESYQFALFSLRNPVIKSFSFIQSLIAYHFAHSISITSESAANFIVNTFGVSRSKITVHPNYVDTSFFIAPQVEPPPSILSVGRNKPQKRHSILLEAATSISLPITIIGNSVKSSADISVIPSNLTLMEPVSPAVLAKTYSSNRYFVILSEYEGHPKVLIEAMCSGLIVIACNAPGVSDNLLHLHNSILIDPNPLALIQAVHLLESDPGLRSRLRKRSLELSHTLFSFDSYIDRELALCRHTVTMHSPPARQ